MIVITNLEIILAAALGEVCNLALWRCSFNRNFDLFPQGVVDTVKGT